MTDLETQIKQHLARIYSHRRIPKGHVEYLLKLKATGFEPKVVYDIGACITEWSDAVKLVWPNARCILFEAYDKLDDVLRKSGYEYFITVLSNTDDAVVKFYQNDTYITGNSYYREVGCAVSCYPENVYVNRITSRLDTIVAREGLPLPDLVKIDVQGAEKDILEGGWKSINAAEHLIVEMQHTEYNQGAPKVDVTRPWIEAHGWDCVAPLFINNGPDGDYGFRRAA